MLSRSNVKHCSMHNTSILEFGVQQPHEDNLQPTALLALSYDQAQHTAELVTHLR